MAVELGLKVCILEDQHQFILHHQVMQNQTDDQVTVEMVTQANSCARFDKGFHSTGQPDRAERALETGGLAPAEENEPAAQEEEKAPEFVKARRAHSAVESAINALEVHGLNVCPDHGIDGFKRYVALAVLARNIHRIGAILWQQDIEREHKKKNYVDRDRDRLAA